MAGGFSLEKYPNLKGWLKEASEDSILRVLCINFLSEILFENIPQNDLKRILSQLDNHITEKRNKGYQIKRQIEDFNENESVGKGQKIKIESNEVFSRVMSLEKIRAFCVGDGYGWDISVGIDSPESIEIFKILIEQHSESNPVFVNFNGKNDIFWFTRAESLRSIKQNVKNIASSVRNALGLDSECGKTLVEIQFESTCIKNGKKPTIFDASFNIFFKPKSKESNWGVTLDSETLAESLPEAIHEKKVIWPNIYKYEILGNPDTLKFPSKKKWRKLRKNSLHILCKDGGIDEGIICEYIVTEKED